MSVPEPMLATASAVGERLKEMNEAFMVSLQGFGTGRRRQGSGSEQDKESSAGSSTARAPSSGTPTIGRRTVVDLRGDVSGSSGSRQEEQPISRTGSRRTASTVSGISDLGLPPAPWVRPRFESTGSARSGLSIASGEVLGRMDPEEDDQYDGRRSSGSGRPQSGRR